MDPTTKPTPSTSSPMRVLIRPPPPPPPPPPPSPPQPPSATTGTTVVGFIGAHPTTISHLINCIIDSHTFGSGRQDTPLELGDAGDEVIEWFKRRKISYYHDFDKGLILLTMCSTKFPADIFDFSDDLDLGNLQGLLFMFVVCHVIIYVQEGSCFNTQILKTLRVLQTAKHALTPFLRSHSNSLFPSISKPTSSSSSSSSTLSSRPPTPVIPSKSPPPRRGSVISNRNSSTSAATSGLGSYMALFPGQCTPVALFVFIDDFSDILNSSSSADDSNDPSSSNQSGTSNLTRSNLPVKGSSPSSVVVLSRPSNKVESGLRKLQSCLEAQVRFLIKKCRTLSGSESSAHVGSRGGTSSGLAPLLTLDASRAVLLIDRSRIQSGKSLDFATSLVEDVLSGKVTPDSLLLESHDGRSGNKEDIMALKEFVFRQADILRGKGGSVVNTNSGSAAGVGMVAVAAAAAAAASTASGRVTSIPELPSFETWLSSTQLILKGILSAKCNSVVDDTDVIRRKFRQRNGTPPRAEVVPSKPADSPDNAVSLLECGEDIDRKFSTSWCQRALPSAMEVYLNDLPPCYPTSQHQAQLDKALRAFYAMVKGPSVPQFMRKLEEECVSIWKNGRQLCDAVSLTGKPCMHPRHVTEDHCSGFVFLHACSCGRSRQLRPDPFDFGSANVGFNVFPDCDNLLPLFQLPKTGISGINQPLSWTIVRLGGARYYEPSKGLLQSGFSLNSKFLLRWTIVLGKDKRSGVSFADALKQRPSSGNVDVKFKSTAEENAKKKTATLVHPGEAQSGDGGDLKDDNGHKYDNKKIGFGRGHSAIENHRTVSGNPKSETKQISFGRGLPNITMKKAFAEVVAGSASDSAFPPLQSKIHTLPAPVKSVKKIATKPDNIYHDNSSTKNAQVPEKSMEVSSAGQVKSNESNPILHIGSNVIPLKVVDEGKNGSEKNNTEGGSIRFNPTSRHFVVYVGFEHECPRGHRFFLTPELLNQLGKPYSLPEESHVNSKHRGNNDVHNRAHRPSNERVVNIRSHLSHQVEQSTLDSETDPQQNLHSLSVDDNGHAFSLINRSLPVYMDCPHCKASKDNKKDRQSLKFAGTISQLQRIFVVTPPFPIVLVTNPIVQFERSCQPVEVASQEHQLQFSLGCQVILPPESVVSIRLPFIYGIEVKDNGLCPLNPFQHQPELTAWIVQGTTLQAIYKPNSSE